jgi:hypothetical protein
VLRRTAAPLFVLLSLLHVACTASASAPPEPELVSAGEPPSPGPVPPDAGITDAGSLDPNDDEDPVATQQTYAAKGLYTYPNQFSEVPDGAFSVADDVVIRREGIVETRRGFYPATGAFPSGSLEALTSFGGFLVGHTSGGKVVRTSDSGATWTEYSGTYTPPTDRRTRFLEMAKSLYMTTSAGVYRLDSAAGTWGAAGVPQAVGGTATLTGSSGFLTANAATAYRLVWGFRNDNNRIILGAPSGRINIANPSGAVSSKNVSLVVPVPDWVTTSHFLQVYRADTSAAADIPAGDDMALAYEAYPTASEVSARTMTVTDIAPDALKGASLYSSPNTGIPGSEKFQPPVCYDIAEYKGRMWCASTTQRQRLLLTLLSVESASGGLFSGAAIVLKQGTTEETYTASTATEVLPTTFKITTTGTVSQQVAATVESLIRCINARSGGMAYAYYVSGEYDSPGQLLIESRGLGDAEIVVRAMSAPRAWAPVLRQRIEGDYDTFAVTRASDIVYVSSPIIHGLVAGQSVVLDSYEVAGDATLFPSGAKTIATIVSPTEFTYAETGADATASGDIFYLTADPEVTSEPSDQPNAVAYSEFGEPDAVPLANYIEVGSANFDVLRVIALGSSLFIFKEDGTYILSGNSPETFNVQGFPTPAKLLAPESAVVLGNAIYALTDQGVVRFTESGAQVVSRPIEGDLLPLYSGDAATRETLKSVAFGVSYETEREYHLFLPSSSSDTYATQAYVYNYATQTWVRWTKPATAGHVNTADGKEYLGEAGRASALVERKTRTSADWQDATGVAIDARVDWAVRTGQDPSGFKQWQKSAVYYANTADYPAPESVTLAFSTELAPTPTSGPFPTSGVPFVWTYVPLEQSRSQTLTVSAQAGEAGKCLAITGLSVDFFTSGTKLR